MACEQSNSVRRRAEKLRRVAQQGFTLVEMAIVLVIIGLIIGGILKGQEIVDNARVKAQVSQIDSIKAAVATFQDQFNYLPGDDPLVGSQLGASAGISGGDGDGFVAKIGTSAAIADTAAPGNEMSLVWYDLQLDRLIEGVTVPANPTNATIFNFPAKLAASDYLWYGDWSSTAGGGTTQNKMIMISGVANLTVPVPAVKTQDANQIDTKYDDGAPTTGVIIQGASSAATNCCGNAACTTANASYGLTATGSPASPYCQTEWLVE